MQSRTNEAEKLTQKELDISLVNASYQGKLDLVIDLIDQGADVNSKQAGPKSALISAANYSRPKVVKYLIEHGAELDARAEYGRTALMYAVSNVSSNFPVEDFLNTIIVLIESGAGVNVTDLTGMTALMYAIQRHSLTAINLLIKAGAKVNDADGYGNTPLINATIYIDTYGNSHEIIEALIKAGADVKTTDKKGRTPLMVAASSGSGRQSVELLIRSGADKKDLYLNGKTELMYAVMWNDFQWVEELIKEKVEINAQDESGKTAFMIAAGKNINLVKCLFQAGAKVNIQDNEGNSALLFAYHKDIIRFLIQEAGADINVVSKDGETALRKAVHWQQRSIVELLLDMNIKREVINAKTKAFLFRGGYTPLGYATERAINDSYSKDKYINIAVLLLRAGADPKVKYDGVTVFDRFKLRTSPEYNEIRELLSLAKKTQKAQKAQKANDSVSISQFSFLAEQPVLLSTPSELSATEASAVAEQARRNRKGNLFSADTLTQAVSVLGLVTPMETQDVTVSKLKQP